MFSPEFVSFTQAIFGNTAARAEIDMAMDFFRGALNRLPETDGYKYWVNRLRTAQCTSAGAVYGEVAAISAQFFQGSEYAGRARSNDQYVADLYNAFLRRGGDLNGVNYWIDQLDTGAMSRDAVRKAFIDSPEFGNRVEAVVAAGCQPPIP
jgi:hypothetical protein